MAKQNILMEQTQAELEEMSTILLRAKEATNAILSILTSQDQKKLVQMSGVGLKLLKTDTSRTNDTIIEVLGYIRRWYLFLQTKNRIGKN